MGVSHIQAPRFYLFCPQLHGPHDSQCGWVGSQGWYQPCTVPEHPTLPGISKLYTESGSPAQLKFLVPMVSSLRILVSLPKRWPCDCIRVSRNPGSHWVPVRDCGVMANVSQPAVLWEGELICSTCWFPWCKYSYHGQWELLTWCQWTWSWWEMSNNAPVYIFSPYRYNRCK